MDNLSGAHGETVIDVMVTLEWLGAVDGGVGYWIDPQVGLGPQYIESYITIITGRTYNSSLVHRECPTLSAVHIPMHSSSHIRSLRLTFHPGIPAHNMSVQN